MPVPTDLASAVAVYTDARGELRVLGPAGWTCAALLAADGSSAVDAYAPGEPDPGAGRSPARSDRAVVASQTGGCVGCDVVQACPLFPAAAAAAAADQLPCTGRPAAESVVRLGGTVVGFEDPPGVAGDGVPSGGPYPANGVVTYVDANHSGQYPSYLATCTLPASQHPLCTASLNLFVSDYGSR